MENPSRSIARTQALAESGRLGGLSTSERKAATARRNGKKGGRPRSIRTIAIGDHASVIVGNVLKVLPTMPDNYYHGLLSDVPYEIGFMGKRWDSSGIAFKVSLWREVYRVLKPGAYVMCFGGSRTFHRLTHTLEKAGFEVRDHIIWLQGQGFPKSKASLKPAYEPIILARKPGKRSLPLNIEGSRIGLEPIERGRVGRHHTSGGGYHFRPTHRPGDSKTVEDHSLGRWPANVLLDEQAAADLGTNARFFYCPKASRTERDAGLDQMPSKPGGTTIKGFTIDASKGQRNRPLHNPHPTVKPLALTRWLARLILPNESKRLLVPFSGTGSEMIGAFEAGWSEVTGIELSPEFAEIAVVRLRHWAHCE